jgi:hypothetical protein
LNINDNFTWIQMIEYGQIHRFEILFF